MSLINDMLKDLDRRNYQPASAHAAALHPPGLAGMHLRNPLAGRDPMLAGAALLVAVVLVAIAFSNTFRLQQMRTPDSDPAKTTRILEIPVRAVVASTVAALQPAAPAQSAPDTIETPVTEQHERKAQAPPAAPASGPASGEDGHFEVTPRPLSPEQRLARDFQAAAAAVNKGNAVEAERLLEDLLARDNSLHKARLLLAGLYVQQQRNSRAESVLASGLLHYPQHAPYASLYAQLLAAQARDSEAINALQGALPAAADDAAYHALLAGLYQRSGKADAAAGSYREALRLAPAHGEWWMGLGISSEQAGDAETAASAYRQALHYPLGKALQQYVQLRLEQLAR
ncbi:MAG TPA: tetratricopeptide repeat protein [Gammaproteobacteria bacterium]|nr:tetratricopeptide repeat protein [Gammaproteobacteria bacterium]